MGVLELVEDGELAKEGVDQVLAELEDLQDETGVSLLIISHDISVIAETCDRLGVMYAGKLMEYGDLESIFAAPHNPYTLGLQNAFPTLRGERQDLISIPGSPPDVRDPPQGCRFRERCPFATEECATAHPPLEAVGEDHRSACYRHDEVERLRTEAGRRRTWRRARGGRSDDPAAAGGGDDD